MILYLLTLSLPFLSLDQKIGQLLIVGFREEEQVVKQIESGEVGGVILYDWDKESNQLGRNISSKEQVKELNHRLQGKATIPLFIAIDQEGGFVNRLKGEYGFPETPSQKTLGLENNLAATHSQGVVTGNTLREVGINLNFAPVVDLESTPASFISKRERAFSADPTAVSQQALELIQGHHEAHVLTTLKHFPGHGSAIGDTHEGFVDTTKSWHVSELEPFAYLIRLNEADLIMTAHIFNSDLDSHLPATLSPNVINKLLRQKLHYEGVVITDDLQMNAIRLFYPLKTIVKLAFLAGNDILLFSNQEAFDPDIAPKVISIVKELIAEGELSESRIDESLARVQALKSRLHP